METIKQKLDQIKGRISDPSFLANQGLSNEVGIHVFCYDPKEEMTIQEYIHWLKKEANPPYRILEYDLYEIFLTLLEEKRILTSIEGIEDRKGSAYLLGQLQKIATPDAFLKRMEYSPHVRGQDVLFLTGIGKVHPFMRAHRILDSMQHLFADIPIVMFYPGTFDGQTLSLFGAFEEGHYYRASKIERVRQPALQRLCRGPVQRVHLPEPVALPARRVLRLYEPLCLDVH